MSREGQVVFALAMSAFVLNLNSNVMGALLPFLEEPFGFGAEGDTGGTMLLAAAGFGSAGGAFFVSDVTRRAGQRGVLGASLTLFVVVSLMHVVVTSFGGLLALRAVAGLSSGLAYATASAAVADVAPYSRRGAVMGRFNAGLFLAIPVGLPLTVILASRGWWHGTFVLQAIVGAVAALLSVRHVPASPRNPLAARGPLLRNRGVLAVLAATTLHVGSFFTVVQLATTWLDDAGLLPKEEQVWVWVGLGVLSVVGSACFGRLSDKLGKRSFVLISSAVLVVCLLVLAQEPDVSVMLPTGCVLALAAAARTGPLQALVSGLVPSTQLGALMGIRGFCMQLGVGLFALGAARLGADLGFRGVLQLAAGCQALSYMAIRLGVREPDRPAAA
ncbi:MAG: MFS transporter [Planctomycetes bacterium]|nr:MFS transporter [Planctomycetota bacterium]